MSDGLPTEEQLERMERTVMGRIRRRAQLPKRIASGVAAAALFAGGVFLLPRFAGSAASGGGSAGSSAGRAYDESGGASGGGSAPLAACHASASAKAPARRVPLRAGTPAAALEACLVALEKGRVPKGDDPRTALKEPISAKDLVVCRDSGGLLQVFVKDAHPSTVCSRNGMTTP
jgi:cytochrome c553